MLGDLAAARTPDARALDVLRQELAAYIRMRFPDVEVDDIVQTVIVRLLSRTTGAAARDVTNPWAYVRRVGHNAAVDEINARHRHEETSWDEAEDAPGEHDPVAALISRETTRTQVVVALRAFVVRQDVTTVHVITHWLDLAEELGRAPSTREVAPGVGVSHTRVAQALRAFRDEVAFTADGPASS